MAQTLRIVPGTRNSGGLLAASRGRLRIDDLGREARRALAGVRVPEGVREVLVTLLATIAFGFGWAALEAGRANSALARESLPAAGMRAGGAAAGGFTGYAPAAMERR